MFLLPLPALMRSYKVQKKAAKVGVDVSDANAALDQIIARAQELKQTLSKQQDSNLLEHQVGDLFVFGSECCQKMRSRTGVFLDKCM